MAIVDYMLPCPSKNIFGIDCFGCGFQRALVLLLEGRFQEAYHLFPPVYSILFFLLMAVLSFIDRKRNYNLSLIALGIVNGIIILVSYFLRHY